MHVLILARSGAQTTVLAASLQKTVLPAPNIHQYIDTNTRSENQTRSVLTSFTQTAPCHKRGCWAHERNTMCSLLNRESRNFHRGWILAFEVLSHEISNIQISEASHGPTKCKTYANAAFQTFETRIFMGEVENISSLNRWSYVPRDRVHTFNQMHSATASIFDPGWEHRVLSRR